MLNDSPVVIPHGVGKCREATKGTARSGFPTVWGNVAKRQKGRSPSAGADFDFIRDGVCNNRERMEKIHKCL